EVVPMRISFEIGRSEAFGFAQRRAQVDDGDGGMLLHVRQELIEPVLRRSEVATRRQVFGINGLLVGCDDKQVTHTALCEPIASLLEQPLVTDQLLLRKGSGWAGERFCAGPFA